jgi:hypothetical protein
MEWIKSLLSLYGLNEGALTHCVLSTRDIHSISVAFWHGVARLVTLISEYDDLIILRLDVKTT